MESGLGCDQAGAGARGGALVGKPKCARILAMTAGSSMVAMSVTGPPTQVSGTVCQVSGDGAYDTKACYESISQRGAKATIPPRRNATQRRCDNSPEKLAIRDANLRQIQQQGRYAWRVASGCTRQSVAENAVFRFKRIFGSRLRARRFDNERVEGWITCMVLNCPIS